MSSITNSVGRGGTNLRPDVTTVQRLLNSAMRSLPGFHPLAVDGLSGPKTIAAIERYQREVVRMMRPDGRVDPNGQTIRLLGGGGGVPAPSPQTKPRWIQIAEREIGVREIAGRQHTPRILEYFQATTYRASTDETPWCSAFANWVMRQAGYTGTNSARAIDWANWGLKLSRPAYGAIGVIDWDGDGPGWKGHVGFVVGETGGRIEMLGGNQSDSVKVSSFGRGNFIAFVVPIGYEVPATAYQLGSAGNVGAGSFQGTR